MQNPVISQVVEALKGANNVLITVKNNPTVDDLTAAIALTLLMSHLDKHATTVFSGQVPSTIEFLQPEMAIEPTTDSLRDFIISLDKSKADKLRYKVEDNIVRIFITPYRTSITEDDLEFGQGDFNVDVVVALGVVGKDDFDHAVTAHGRILHDATVIGVTNSDVSQIGAINWLDKQASSISEMIAGITDAFGSEALDNQIATALLTGMVSETDRFKNEKTTPEVLSLSSKLMSAGANQQLVAEKLETTPAAPLPVNQPEQPQQTETPSPDGTLKIGHEEGEVDNPQSIDIDNKGNLEADYAKQTNEPDTPPESVALQDSVPPLELPEVKAPGVSEAPDRPYLAKKPSESPAAPSPKDGDNSSTKPPTGSLFGATSSQEVNDDKEDDEDTNPGNHTLEHQHKIIQPLSDVSRHDIPPTPPTKPTVTESGSLKFEPTLSKVPIEEPSQPKQTLRDLERSVHSKHLSTEERGEARAKPPSTTPEATKNTPPAPYIFTDVPKKPTVSQSPTPVKAPATDSKVDTKKDKTEEKVEPPQPQEPPKPVYTPPVSTAPPGPPPLMPQAGAQPVFYEADGSKSNPFTGADKK